MHYRQKNRPGLLTKGGGSSAGPIYLNGESGGLKYAIHPIQSTTRAMVPATL